MENKVETNLFFPLIVVITGSSEGDNSWAAPLVATLATVIVVMVTAAVVVLVAILVYKKAHQRHSKQGWHTF